MQKQIHVLVIAITAVVLFYVCYNAESVFDSGDGLMHYFMSKFSWKHPGLLLDHWGKPFFTLLSSPFSQFGLLGMSVFQIICALATSYFCIRIVLKLKLNFSWLLPVFICFAPIYFAVINSGLTEILFGCLLMFSIWMIFEKKYYFAAIAASFLPFVRVDAYVTVPLIALLLLVRRQYKALTFLPFGFVIYSIIGYFYYHDLWWVINLSQSFFEEGYPGMKGNFFHYPKNYNGILGIPLTILFIAGFLSGIYYLTLVLRRKHNEEFIIEKYILIYGSFLACLLIHTLSYSLPGVLNNLGMIRYMASLIPSAAVISLIGMNSILEFFKNFRLLDNIIVFSFTAFILIVPFKQWYFPFSMDREQTTLQSAVKWIEKNNISYSKICYFHPAFPLFMKIDPFDESRVIKNIDIDQPLPTSNFPNGGMIIWDPHYGANEGHIPIEKLESNPYLQLLQSFKSVEKTTTINNRLFEIRIYKVK